MSDYLITVTGCDASTEVVRFLTDNEKRTIEDLAVALAEASTFGCMPTMTIHAATEADSARVAEDAAERKANP